MTRRHLSFGCAGSILWGTLDEAPGGTGLLMVSGGNEIRCGPWGSQAQLAATLAGLGWPVFRFDRRGVGDSEGPNEGFRSSAPDIAAALAAFREAAPHLTRIVAFGNCDAASALVLCGGAGADALVLANPWTFDDDAGEAKARSVVRAHYRRRLTDPLALRRLLTGQVSLRKLMASLASAARPRAATGVLETEIAKALRGIGVPLTILIAELDRTGQAFLGGWNAGDPRVKICPGATHSFVEAHARDWLIEQLSGVLRDHSTSSVATA